MEAPEISCSETPHFAGQNMLSRRDRKSSISIFRISLYCWTKCFQKAMEIPAIQSLDFPYFAGQNMLPKAMAEV
jgi:hypothetical protein